MPHITKYGEFEKLFRLNRGMLLASNELDDHETLLRIGYNAAAGTAFEHISTDGIWQAPRPSEALPLRIRAGGSPDDAVSGPGAQAVLVRGINALGDRQQEVLPLNGASQSAQTVGSYIRVHEFLVLATGTPYLPLTSPHAGDILLESTSGALWGAIRDGAGRFTCGNFMVPRGHIAYLTEFTVFASSDRGTDFVAHQATGLLTETAPFGAQIRGLQLDNIHGAFRAVLPEIIALPPLSEITFAARVRSGMASSASAFATLILNKIVPQEDT